MLEMELKMHSQVMTYGSASSLKIMSWKCRGYPRNKGLRLSHIAYDKDIMFLAKIWEHEAKGIANIDGYIIKSL